MNRIYLSVPHIGQLEERYVQDAFTSNWVSTLGPNLQHFESDFSALHEQLPCVALASGTAAIHLGLRLLGVRPGDEVVCSTLTFIASVNPILYLGAQPIFVDSERSSWNLCPERLSDLLREKSRKNKLPKAVIVVDLYGQSADIDSILEVCNRYEIPVLEDAAEALGSYYKSRRAGTRAPLAAFSFNGNKIITTSGGGMLLGHDASWIQKARFWSQQARDPGIAYEHTEMGYNYRMSNVLAGIGRGQLAVLEERVQQRRRVAFRYREAFADIPGIELMPQALYGVHTYWLSCFLIDEAQLGASRDDLIQALDQHNIESRPVWKPMHLQPLFRSTPCYGGEVAEDLFRRGICLPSSSCMTDDEQMRVINVVRKTATSRTF